MLEEKSKGGEITVAAPEAPARAQIIDLMQALKQSIEKAKPQKAAPAQRKRKTAS
jgi:non-homologous end joining protein Ku